MKKNVLAAKETHPDILPGGPVGLNNLSESCVHLTNGELSQDLYSKNSAKFEGRCISHNSIFPCTCRLSTTI